MIDIKIVLHPSGDWEGLYIDGRLVSEGHSIRVEDLVEQLHKHFYFKYDQYEADMDVDSPSMPDNLPSKLT